MRIVAQVSRVTEVIIVVFGGRVSILVCRPLFVDTGFLTDMLVSIAPAPLLDMWYAYGDI